MTSKQVKIYLSDKEYERLRQVAESLGMRPTTLVKKIVLEFLGINTEEGSGIATKIRELEAKYEQLAKEVGRIGRELEIVKKKLKRMGI